MKYKYLVYRIYSAKERPDITERSVFYGWSDNKNVVKALLKQRSKDKYMSVKMTEDEVEMIEQYEDIIVADNMIDYIKLRSAKTHEEIHFFSTLNELRETEMKIQRLFHDMSSLDRIKGSGNYINMLLCLNEYYREALYYIGYRPPEIDILFSSADERDNYSNLYEVEANIHDAYDGMAEFPSDLDKIDHSLPGLSTIEDVASKSIYSIESFIKVLKDDL